MVDQWRVWHDARGKVKGISIVHRAASHGLELHTELLPEHRQEFLKDLCDKLNRPADDFRQQVEERAVRYIRSPLALTALCNLCGETTQSMSVHRMDPPTRHVTDCPLYSTNDAKADHD